MRSWSVILILTILSGCRMLTEKPCDDVASLSGEASYQIEPVGEIIRFTGPEDLSGIDRIDGDRYVGVADSHGVFAELEIEIDPTNGAVTSFVCVHTNVLNGVVDAESVAFDRFSSHIWVSDEASETIREFDLSGNRFREVKLPECFRRCHANYGLESLAVDPSGKVMWTCNEETLACDGELSTKKHGSFVRLTRFVRAGVTDAWRCDGQWVYRTGRVRGGTYKGVSFSGVSDLCVLPDGTLLVLEREMSRSLLPRFRARIYQVDFRDATDILSFESLKGTEWTPVRKTRIFEEHTGRANYEGMCLGPRLSDGSYVLLLVSDGDGLATERLYSLRIRPASAPVQSM